MKKTLVLGALVMAIGAGSIIGYADTAKTPNIISENKVGNFNMENREALLKERTELRKESVKQALKNGEITEEDAKYWEDHYDYMEEHHNRTGTMSGGGCHGYNRTGNSYSGNHSGTGMHMGGRGMMGGRDMTRSYDF